MPGWSIEVLAPVHKRTERLPRRERERLLGAILALADDPFAHDLVRLKGRPEWRLRVGGWRVLLRIDEENRKIFAVALGSRGDIYK